MKKQQPSANSTETKQGDKKQKQSTEKSQDDSKNKKQQSESNPTENKNKKPATAVAASSNKTYFTAGAQGDNEHSYRTLDTLISLFEQAIRKAFPEDQTLPVLVVPGRQTDYQCNSAMSIAQVRKTFELKKPKINN